MSWWLFAFSLHLGSVFTWSRPKNPHSGRLRLTTFRFGSFAAQALLHTLDIQPTIENLLGGPAFAAQIWPGNGQLRGHLVKRFFPSGSTSLPMCAAGLGLLRRRTRIRARFTSPTTRRSTTLNTAPTRHLSRFGACLSARKAKTPSGHWQVAASLPRIVAALSPLRRTLVHLCAGGGPCESPPWR